MLDVHPMADVAEVITLGQRPGAVLLPSPPELDGTTTLERQIVAAATAGGIDEPTELADYAIEVLDAEQLLPREPWPFSRGELQIGAFIVAIGQPFRHLVLVDPSAGLDARRRRALAGFLADLAAEGHRITVASDDPLFT